MAIKILISGLPNTRKTSLIKDLDDVLVIANDNKKFPFNLPNKTVPEVPTADTFIDICENALDAYDTKFDKLPKYIVIDTISKVWLDIEAHYSKTKSGFDVWAGIGKDIPIIRKYIENTIIREYGISVIFISHLVEQDSGKQELVKCGGNALKDGGVISDVDYAITIERRGRKLNVRHSGSDLSRNLQYADLPETEPIDTFNLKQYLKNIEDSYVEADKWSL